MREKSSLKKTGRLAGLLWLLAGAGGGFALVYIRSNFIVNNDAALTAQHIMAHESLFRAAIAGNLCGQILMLFFGLTGFRLFKGVNRSWAALFLISIVITVAVAVVNSLNNVGALTVLGSADYLKAFSPEQLDALMMIFFRLNNLGIGFQELFLGLSLFSFGMLIVKSGYAPRILGILLMIGSCWFPINTFTKILFPDFYPAAITQLTMLFNGLGGLPNIFWLLIKGADNSIPKSGG